MKRKTLVERILEKLRAIFVVLISVMSTRKRPQGSRHGIDESVDSPTHYETDEKSKHNAGIVDKLIPSNHPEIHEVTKLAIKKYSGGIWKRELFQFVRI